MPTEPSKTETPSRPQPRRERSTRYPGVPLSESLKICESIEELGVDGFTSPDIANSLGYKSIKTNTFSARLSGARQFGLIELRGEGYHLTTLAKEILHPVDLGELSKLQRQAFLNPPLYAELAERFEGKKLPDPSILGNVLYHSHQIIATAKQAAAEAFLESARFCGILGEDQIFRAGGSDPVLSAPAATLPLAEKVDAPRATPTVRRPRPQEVRVDIQLWDLDEGKAIRLRAPRSITPASYERFLQAFQLLVRVEEPPGS